MLDAFKGDRLFAQYSASTQVLQLHKRLIRFKKARVTGQASSYKQPRTPAETTEILSGVSGCKYMTILFFYELKFCSETLTFLFPFKWTARHVFPRDICTSSNEFSRTAHPPTAFSLRQYRKLVLKDGFFLFLSTLSPSPLSFMLLLRKMRKAELLQHNRTLI